jgi:hypothetical protein
MCPAAFPDFIQQAAAQINLESERDIVATMTLHPEY